jgi:ABC-type antimicrobial peptide transport system permease subunit
MGSGAMLSYGLIPAGVRNTFNDPHPGPNVILVRLKGTDSRRAAVASLQKIAEETSNTANFGVLVQSVLLPAEIINYRSLGTTPAYLSGGFAIGALIALSLVLVASVRRRRRDFAVYKTLGFTGRQLALTVAWHATITMSIGIVLGIPLGVALGRWLWDLFARNINVVPAPNVPGWTIGIIIIGALALANLIAVIPGRAASRTSTAFLLRSE